MGQVQHFKATIDPFGDFSFGKFARAQAKGHIFINVEMGKKRVALKNRVHLALDGGKIGDVLAATENLPRVGQFQSGYNAQQSRLTAPGRAQQGKKLPGTYRQGDIVQNDGIHECFVDIFYGEALVFLSLQDCIHLRVYSEGVLCGFLCNHMGFGGAQNVGRLFSLDNGQAGVLPAGPTVFQTVHMFKSQPGKFLGQLG